MERTLFIRADGNSRIGLGHLMRCLSVAKEVQKRGMQCVFVTADEEGEGFIKEKGFSVHCLHGSLNKPREEILGEEIPGEEIPLMQELLKKKPGSGLLVDSYFVDSGYYESLRMYALVACFDEFGNEPLPVDFLINYNIYAENLEYGGKYGGKTNLLLGSRFAPLREEFQGRKKRELGKVRKILITTGATDPYHVTLRLLEKYCSELKEYSFVTVAGRYNKDMEKLAKLARANKNIMLHRDVKNMAELMEECDIAVSAGGTTLYELCACGLPAVTYSFADNQLPGTSEFGRRNLMINLGDIRVLKNHGIDEMYEGMILLIENEGLRKDMSERMQKELDGNGAGRIAEQLVRRVYEDTIRKTAN